MANGFESVVDGKHMEEEVVVREEALQCDLLEEHSVANIHHSCHLSLPLEAAVELHSNGPSTAAPCASFSNKRRIRS